MKIAIYSRCGSAKQEEGVVRLIANLSGMVDILLYEPLYNNIAQKYKLSLKQEELFNDASDLSFDVVCVITVGGDGTLLDAVPLVIDNKIPLVGLSTGRLGFLTALNFNDLDTALDNILHGRFEVEHRSLLQLHSDLGENLYALNDVCIQKRGAAIAEINVHINGEFVSTYWADGLIISTPTGSTAYALSAGGPIINPHVPCLVIAPISPHNFTMRPIVVPNDSVLSFDMHTRSGGVVVGIDSKEYELPSSSKLTVQQAEQQIGFVKLNSISFYQTLHKKLLWGVDARSQ